MSLKEKRPDLEEYVINKQDMLLSTQSHKKIQVRCPLCKTEKEIIVFNLSRQGVGCRTCSSGISIPEKFVFNLFRELELEFIKEYSPEWANKKRYDFYIPSLNMIIETHGIQHYQESSRGRTLIEEQENDIFKEKLAKENGIKNYIILDCRKSEREFLISELQNKFSSIFDLSKIDMSRVWIKIFEESLKKEIIEEYLKNNLTIEQIALTYKVGTTTIKRYIKESGVERRNKKISTEEVFELFQKYGNKTTVSLELGISRPAVRRHLLKYEKDRKGV